MKKILYIAFLFILFNPTIFKAKIINEPIPNTHFTPQNTVIIFDIDGVLVERSFWQYWHNYWELLKECPTFEVIKFLGWQLLNLSTLFEKLKHEDIEVYLDDLSHDWPFLLKETPTGTIIERLKATISKAIPKQETIDILLELHKQGYKIALATNEIRNTFNRIINAGVLPDLSTYSLIYTADACISKPFLKKPAEEYYQCLMQTIAQKENWQPEHYIFIDEMEPNVLASAKVGITSILYKDHQTLKEDLTTLGIK